MADDNNIDRIIEEIKKLNYQDKLKVLKKAVQTLRNERNIKEDTRKASSEIEDEIVGDIDIREHMDSEIIRDINELLHKKTSGKS